MSDDLSLVRALVDARFPSWSGLPLAPLGSGATDNVVARLGSDLVVRLPRNPDAAQRLAGEVRWLPAIAGRVSVPVPEIVAIGQPGLGVPHRWVVQRWLDGIDATGTVPADLPAAAHSLAAFVCELRAVGADGGPRPGPLTSLRGLPLDALDERVRWGAAVTTRLGSAHPFTVGLDVARVLAVWDEALAAPAWTGPPTWLHGDLLPGNVLLRGDTLAAVLDFGCAAVGDPACDGLAAWTLFRGAARAAYLAATCPDPAVRARARGWAVYVGITAAGYHADTDPAFCTFARAVLDDLLAEG